MGRKAGSIQQTESQLKKSKGILQARIDRIDEKIKVVRNQNRILATCIRLREVARILGVSGQTVLRWSQERRLKAIRNYPRGQWWITKRSLQKLHDTLMNSRTVSQRKDISTPV
jgi:DNA invertase Pin-like site-specific DNA recombinase